MKQEIFRRLDALCPERTILASNSSSFVPSRIAEATQRPDRVINIHFFNPALVMKCVEVVRGPQTSAETLAAAVALVETLDKVPVVMQKEINGFIANRILDAIRTEPSSCSRAGTPPSPTSTWPAAPRWATPRARSNCRT